MNKPNNKKSSTAIYLSSLSLSLSHVNLSECDLCINEGGNLPIYTNKVTNLLHDYGRPLTLTRSTSPRETPNTHYMILHWELFPRITMQVIPQVISQK